MINTGIQLIPEINFEIVKFSKKRGTEERFFAKNVVLDSGFEYLLDALFDSDSFTNLAAGQGVQFPSVSSLAVPRWLFLGTGTTEPSRSDTGLEAVSTTAGGRQASSSVNYGFLDRDPVTGTGWGEVKRTYAWGEGQAVGTWTEGGLAFWDRIGHPGLRGSDNTYTNPYSRSLFRKGLERDSGTASAGGATTLSDAAKAWTVDAWKDNYTVYIVGGTGTGQSREITGNTATELTVAAWDTPPDATSQYEIRGTPTSITVLEDEYLTIFGYQRMYMRHAADAWTGVLTFKGNEVPWEAYVADGIFTGTGTTNVASPNYPHRLGCTTYRLTETNSFPSGGGQSLNAMSMTYDKALRLCSGSFDLDPSTDRRCLANLYIRGTGSWGPLNIYIIPDWDQLPEEHRVYVPVGGHQRNYAYWPPGERLKGSASYSMFRGD